MQIRIVIRAKDEAAKIGTTLSRLAQQTLADRAEVVVVDSGSRDGTVDIARSAGVRVIEIPAASFSYGGAINIGCEGATTPLVVAVSAHAPPFDEHWLERVVEPFEHERVACACGYECGPDGMPLDGPLVQDLELARRYPFWGYSNSAGAFRTELWRQRPFREDMPATEDKEWAWHWLNEGRLVVVDPRLATRHSHHDDGPLKTYARGRAVWRGFSMYLDLEPYGSRELLHEWWTGLDGYPSRVRARIGWRRAARLVGKWRGRARAG